MIIPLFHRCRLNPCYNNPCGSNADCEKSRAGSAVCRCRAGKIQYNPYRNPSSYIFSFCNIGYVGDPFVGCNLEPCSQDPCGVQAECDSRGRTAICRCPRGFTGDPYARCSPDPCSQDPCGKMDFIGTESMILTFTFFQDLELFVRIVEIGQHADALQVGLVIHKLLASKTFEISF